MESNLSDRELLIGNYILAVENNIIGKMTLKNQSTIKTMIEDLRNLLYNDPDEEQKLKFFDAMDESRNALAENLYQQDLVLMKQTVFERMKGVIDNMEGAGSRESITKQ